jgi:hypothetical protein
MYTKSPLRSVSIVKTQVASYSARPAGFDSSVYVSKNLPLDDVLKLK